MDDIEYYTHLTTARLVDELNYHFKETLTDPVIMNIEDMRTFYLNRCGAIVSVLFERQPKEDLEHILQVQQELESALI
ncbi:hypothetical protein N9L40_01445 [Rhodobacteraceae bacterium]|nr:hypothetical protein [Paracoccaceae bacterium]